VNQLIFDLDGTLIDSADSIRGALAESCKINNIEPLMPISELAIGPPLDEMLKSILPGNLSYRHNLLKKSFVELYDQDFCMQGFLYPGVMDALVQASANANLFLVTNKRISPTVKILRHQNILQLFKGVIGCDSVDCSGFSKSKSIAHLIREHGLSKADCTYFGDTEGDAIACDEVGIDFIYIPWGYGDISTKPNLSSFSGSFEPKQ